MRDEHSERVKARLAPGLVVGRFRVSRVLSLTQARTTARETRDAQGIAFAREDNKTMQNYTTLRSMLVDSHSQKLREMCSVARHYLNKQVSVTWKMGWDGHEDVPTSYLCSFILAGIRAYEILRLSDESEGVDINSQFSPSYAVDSLEGASSDCGCTSIWKM